MNARKFMSMFLVVCMMLTLASCIQDDAKTQPPAGVQTSIQNTPSLKLFEGKIGIITNSDSLANFEYVAAKNVTRKYGDSKILHTTWPDGFMTDEDSYAAIINKQYEDVDIKSIIVSDRPPFVGKAINRLNDDHNDTLIVYISSDIESVKITKQADVILYTDELSIVTDIVQQTLKLGAKVFVHYSFPRHMEQKILSRQHDLIREECEKLGLEFIDATAPDPTSDADVAGAQQFILEDVPKMVAKYGKDTAFFATACAMQPALIKAIVKEGAIYPSPCCPSPYHGFIDALGLDSYFDDSLPSAKDAITKIRIELENKNMLRRVSTWPVDPDMMLVEVSTEYAIKRLNGEVPQEGIDIAVLTQLMTDYAGVQVYLTPYTDPETGETYDNYLMMRMDYITFE